MTHGSKEDYMNSDMNLLQQNFISAGTWKFCLDYEEISYHNVTPPQKQNTGLFSQFSDVCNHF
jgi:hypothetical protein